MAARDPKQGRGRRSRSVIPSRQNAVLCRRERGLSTRVGSLRRCDVATTPLGRSPQPNDGGKSMLRSRSFFSAIVVGLVMALAVPAIALGQSQGGTSGHGDGSNSGSVSNTQSNSQSAAGTGNQQNATNQNCVAGRDC